MRLRSLLYVPAHSERFLSRAHERGADAIILDLEDAVPQEHKQAARDGLPASVAAVRRNGAQVFVRINPDGGGRRPHWASKARKCCAKPASTRWPSLQR